jgi:hypothetical protein
MWDYATGKPFQHIVDVPQPGSLDAESGVFCSTFDKTGTRLITGGADKTIKVGPQWRLSPMMLYRILTRVVFVAPDLLRAGLGARLGKQREVEISMIFPVTAVILSSDSLSKPLWQSRS